MLGGKEKCCWFSVHLMQFEWWSLSGCMTVSISYRSINVLLFKHGLWSSLCKSPEIVDDSNVCLYRYNNWISENSSPKRSSNSAKS